MHVGRKSGNRCQVILLLGGSGYVGSAFRRVLESNNVSYRSISRKEYDYTKRDVLVSLIHNTSTEFVINSAGYTGKPNVDACESHKADCLLGNAVLPAVIREACELCDVAWGHVSSGCIYTGLRADGRGFNESDPANFCFRTNNCGFYSGCKAIGEECLEGSEHTYVWRLRIPFNHIDSGRNYLSKLLRYERLLDARNSISQLDEFASACLQTWTRRVPFGIYNITNTGSVTAREVVEHLKRELNINKTFTFFSSEEQFMSMAAKAPRSNCVLDNSKILATGIVMSDVHDAITRSLRNWVPETTT